MYGLCGRQGKPARSVRVSEVMDRMFHDLIAQRIRDQYSRLAINVEQVERNMEIIHENGNVEPRPTALGEVVRRLATSSWAFFCGVWTKRKPVKLAETMCEVLGCASIARCRAAG